MIDELENILGYHFNNKNLLSQALTHSSVTANEHKNYERLEFLGDRVLGMTMAHLLYTLFPEDKEGQLAQRHVLLVCADRVAQVAHRLHLDKYVRVRDKISLDSINVMCDVCEAIIGAIYIDSDIEQAISFVERNWRDFIDVNIAALKDAKTQLQEKFHGLKKEPPIYEVVEKTGTEHQPMFMIKVALDDNIYAIGYGKNKKTAEQNAAAELLKIMEQ